MAGTQWQPLPFDRSVHEARIERARKEAAQQGLDALLLFSQETLYYLFGYDQLGYWVYQVVVFPVEGGEPVVLTRGADVGLAEQSPFLNDVRMWADDEERGPGAITRGILEELFPGRSSLRVGVERRSHSLLPVYWDELKAECAGYAELVDASDLVARHRIVKDAGEVELFLEAVGHMAAGYEAARTRMVEGVRECDLFAAIYSTMFSRGAASPAIATPLSSGPRTMSQTHALATDRAISEGEPILIEVGAAAKRYHAVGAQTYVIGEPPAALRELHDTAVAALEAGFEKMAPGQPLSEVAKAAHAELEARGQSRAGRHFGYGTGIGFPPTWLEDTRIKVSSDEEALPGMTFFYYVGLNDPEREICVYVGEPVLIAEDGVKRPADMAYDRWIV